MIDELDKIYEKYSKINQYSGVGLDYFRKVENKTVYYFVPSWISIYDENRWVADFRMSKILNKDVYAFIELFVIEKIRVFIFQV